LWEIAVEERRFSAASSPDIDGALAPGVAFTRPRILCDTLPFTLPRRQRCILPFVILSVVIITYNEEANIARTLESVQPLVRDGRGEIIVVDSGSIDRTVEIAKSFGAKVFIEKWKGFAAQKNLAIDKAGGDWILSLDADEEVDRDLQSLIGHVTPEWKPHPRKELLEAFGFPMATPDTNGYWMRRRNKFMGRWMEHGGLWPDPKLRLFRRRTGRFEDRLVHEDIAVEGKIGTFRDGALIHYSYPTLSDYIDHMNRYSSLGAEMEVAKGKVRFSIANIVLRPILTFIYNYILRLGFLDGREGLLLHLYHAVYVSWKYAKAWELSRKPSNSSPIQ
jgi:glycosyltransferase involved in cell wall biosynthesis